MTATWSVDLRALARLTLSAALRYESARFDDDQNLHRLGPAATANLGADWRVSRRVSLFLAVDNLFNVAVATGQTASYVTSYGPPRAVLAGLKILGPR